MRGKATLLAALLVISMVATAAMPAAAQPQANGTVSISADPASDGSSYDYAINDESAASNLSVELTGRDNAVWANQSGSSIAPNESIPLDIGGTSEPIGATPASDPSISITGYAPNVDHSAEYVDLGDKDDNSRYDYTNTVTSKINGRVTAINWGTLDMVSGSNYGFKVDIYVNNNLVRQDVSPNIGGSTSFDGVYVSDGESVNYRIKTVNSNNNDDYDFGTVKVSPEITADLSDVSISGDAGSSASLGSFVSGETKTTTLDLSRDTSKLSISSSGGGNFDYNLSLRETAKTRDPQVSINGNSVGVDGVLSDGETRSLSVSDNWISAGRNNVSVTTNGSAGGPASVVGFEFSHDAATTISTSATSTQFESRYNISHTYRSATDNATVLLPFDSGRVVEIHNVEYRINGGSWDSLTGAEYVFNGSQITADISAAYGGELPEDSTVDVRSTGRKIDVRNGAVSVTDPTAPGDELDTKLSIDSKSDGFAVNVGPTESGSRVHYGLSDDFGGSGPDGSAVIEANGDQHVQFPNALPGDTVRMKHLRTQVKPQSGDVRIAVQEAGSDPKIDVSPGPGGEGDPVDIKYYRTQTNKEYILESLTQGIVLDSDTAESPAVFTDDDSDETWLIALGTVGGDGDTEEGEGIIGQVPQSTGIEFPFSGGVQPLIALLAIGALATVYFRGPDGFAYFSRAGGRAASATRSSIPIVGGLLGRLFGVIGTALSYGFGGLVRLAGLARSRPRLAAGVVGVASMAAVAFGVIPLPIELVFAAGVPLVSFVLLREIGQFNVTVWAATSIAAFLGSLVALGVSFDGLINEQTSLILAVGGLYIAYQVVQTWRQGQITEVVIPGRNGGDDQ